MNETKTYTSQKSKPKNNYPEFIIVHHTGGENGVDTSNQTAKIVEDYHISKGWSGIGYHYFITKKGEVWLGRPEHRNGAHTVGYNEKSIAICLAGNFDVTLPTKEQSEALAKLLKEIQGKYLIPPSKIVPHRTFAKKSCFGSRLPDNWARKLLEAETPKNPPTPPPLTAEQEVIRKSLGEQLWYWYKKMMGIE